MEEQKTVPLSIMLENVKSKTVKNISEIMQESSLPAFLMEGIIADILANIRNQKNTELVSDFNVLLNQKQESEKPEKEKEGEE